MGRPRTEWPSWTDQCHPPPVSAALIAGIAAYRRHPFQRAAAEPPAIWAEGATRLLDYATPARPPSPGDAPPLLFVPSLVNRGYILDLVPERSMLRWLAERGARPLLLDWGYPDEAARAFTLTDYIAGRLERALDAIDAPRVVLVGYCLGGLLALATALRRRRSVSGLVLLATPWDFHADGAAPMARSLAALLPLLEPVMHAAGLLPTDVLQALLSLPDMDGVANRYREFAAVDQASERARSFVALEDWLSDGVPLAAAVVRECLGGWYGRNTTAGLAWRVAGAVVDPAAVRVPTFVAVPSRDRVVPPASAMPLTRLIPGAVGLYPRAGHIGMAAGSNAEPELWAPLLAWLRRLET